MQPRPDLVVSGINRGYNLGLLRLHLGHAGGGSRRGDVRRARGGRVDADERATAGDYIAAAEEVLGVARRVKQFGLRARTPS